MFNLRSMACGSTGLLVSALLLLATLAPVSVAAAAATHGQRVACAESAPAWA